MKFSTINDILGNNFRIRNLILPHNHRRDFPLVDNKVKTSQLALANNIPTPNTLLHIRFHGEVRGAITQLREFKNGFVVKPGRGSQGGGILIVKAVVEHGGSPLFITSKEDMTEYRFRHYISGILSGLYSLDNQADEAIIQELIINSPNISSISPLGVPDIRIIVFQGFPIMAMLRIPTNVSGGKGNLHLGAVGCGLDLKTGLIFHSIQFDREVTNHPDTRLKLKGFQIENWSTVLSLSAKASLLARIGYLGVDIVIDKSRGPLLLEMNARPGLSIQLANNRGLKPLLKKIISDAPLNLSPNEKIPWALENL